MNKLVLIEETDLNITPRVFIFNNEIDMKDFFGEKRYDIVMKMSDRVITSNMVGVNTTWKILWGKQQ